MTSLSFHGAAGTVTGSRFLINAAGQEVLVDCGLFQGPKELRLRNWERPAFDPAKLEAVVLTHAHLDHSGWLPRLGKLGFRGPVWCTRATADLARLLLEDSAHLQEEDAEYANRKGFTAHRPALPLYTVAEARDVLRRLRVVDYGKSFQPVPNVACRALPVGHIVGSAMIELVATATAPLRFLFSGDVGRYGAPLVADPSPPPACDVLVVESTYGDRLHGSASTDQELAAVLRRAATRGGIVLIPAFAVGRAQQLIVLLKRAMERGDVPEMAIHLDSPMAVDATAIYVRYAEEAGLEEFALERHLAGRSLFGTGVYLHSTRDESLRLNALHGPRVILASSGMLAGGRVLHHLRRLLPDPKNVVLLAGHQAEGTRGRALQHGARFLRVHGEDIPVRAEIAELHGVSGHADAGELVRWLRDLPSPPGKCFIVHGEPAAAEALKVRLERELRFSCTVARHLERIEW